MSDERNLVAQENQSDILIYQTEAGNTKIDVRFVDETVWLSQQQMAELFQSSRTNIVEHIQHIYEEGELDETSTCRNFRQVRIEGSRQVTREIPHYNLDMIISLGYRVKSKVATNFRRWATERLKEYMVKGFAMDDERLKNLGGGNYWKELLDRIRDIRSSEKVMYRQVLDLYATSVDYDPKSSESIVFFKMVQNKLHFAAHGHTAAELIYERADANKPFMGLTTFSGDFPTAKDIGIAKNYLSEEELQVLNRIVSGYFDFAEVQAMRRRPMHMSDYVEHLDQLLSSTGEHLLIGAGKVSHKQAMEKANQEYQRFLVQNLSPAEEAYLQTIKEVENTAKKKIEGELTMAFTNTKESGLESLIVKWLVEQNGYEEGTNADYNKEYAVDETRLFRFLQDTQPREMAKLGAFASETKKRQFLNRLSGEIAKRGIIDVLRKGIKVYPADLIMFYLTPTEHNQKAKIMYEKNIFSVTRQLRYAQDARKLALDVCLFINGLPVITIELKNQLTKQNTENAVRQYKEDRDPRDLLFSFKRCMVHFAVDDATIQFCTKLAGKDSWFLPFNKGYNDGAGNPPNPNGLKTDYLWKDILTKRKLSLIIENYAQIVEEVDEDTKRKSIKQIWPRYHQLDCVEKLLADVQENGVGKRYLIQHSAGSGKSNSIAWLAHQLIGLEQDGRPMIDSVLVVTDRRILDKQIRNTIKQFMQVKNTVTWAEHSSDLRKAIQGGKRIIISTIEKFPYIIAEIGQEHKNNKFAIIIDEAHSGQSGRNSANMNLALSGLATDDDADNEDKINSMMEGRKLVSSASYFAFTATPKNKTEEMFGIAYEEDGTVKHHPFHVYTMKQAIQEGFILDVLRNYTTIDSWYKIMKTVEDDPMFDKKRAQKKLRAFVEGNPDVIAKKAAIMVEHFHEQVIARKKIAGKARAMVVTASIPRCIEYYYAINKCLADRRSPYKAIVAFSGEHHYKGQAPGLTSASMNGFPDAKIPKEFKKEPFRILIVADMFQTGFDEPLLQTMYVDKPLYDIAAVQTLSRLNRAYPGKDEVYVLDFANKTPVIEEAFSKFYRTTILSGETDPNKLYDLIAILEGYQVYDDSDVEKLVDLFLSGAERDRLDPILDACVAVFNQLELDAQIEFKSTAKSFVRTYGFLGAILPYGNVSWEKLSIFLNLLIPKLPSPADDDFSKGILQTIDLSSYRNEAREAIAIKLEDADAEIAPVPAGKVGYVTEPEMDLLSKIILDFNDMFGNIDWKDADNVQRQILAIPEMVSKDKKYQNAMRNSDAQEARTESERALQKVIFSIMPDNMELFKQFQDNPSFKRWLSDLVFYLTYTPESKVMPISDQMKAKYYLMAEQDVRAAEAQAPKEFK